MATSSVPLYFELSWSILSTIGMIDVLLGLLVSGITAFSPITAVPIVVSAACAVANGLCYYAFYANYSETPTLVAAAFADVAWLIQEAGLSFYSYQILTRILSSRARTTFMALFWFLMVVIASLRTAIVISRQILIRHSTTELQLRIDHLHVGYFISIALVECVSAFFLLRVFAAAQSSVAIVSKSGANGKSTEGTGLFRTLIRSTETRLATLALVGITRAVTYSFQTTAQSATTIASQVDRFAYALECMFPMVMLIDIMASKLQISIHNESSARSRMNGTYNPNQTNGQHRIRVTTTTVVTHPNDNDEERAKMPRQSFIRMDDLEGKGSGKTTWEVERGVPLVVHEVEDTV